MSDLKSLVVVGYIVLLLMVAGLILDTYRSKAASYEGLKDQVTAQNAKMDLIILQMGRYQAPQ